MWRVIEYIHLAVSVKKIYGSSTVMLHMSKVCDILVNAILNYVDLTCFSVPSCSTNLPSI